MKVLTVKFYLCDRGHKHTTKDKCRACDKVTRRVKLKPPKNVRTYVTCAGRRKRMEIAYYMHNRGKSFEEIGVALKLTPFGAKGYLALARNLRYNKKGPWYALERILEHTPEQIAAAAELCKGREFEPERMDAEGNYYYY